MNLQESLKKIKENVEVGAITLGSKGSIVFQNQIEKLVTPVTVNDLVDTTGAGDLFAAGFLAEYIKTQDLQSSGKQGVKMASIIIQQFGARI